MSIDVAIAEAGLDIVANVREAVIGLCVLAALSAVFIVLASLATDPDSGVEID